MPWYVGVAALGVAAVFVVIVWLKASNSSTETLLRDALAQKKAAKDAAVEQLNAKFEQEKTETKNELAEIKKISDEDLRRTRAIELLARVRGVH